MADFLFLLAKINLTIAGAILIVALLLSTVATLETTLIQVTRTLFTMGRDETLPKVLGTTHPTRKTPFVATMVVTVLADNLGVDCIAEGVETKEQLQYLQRQMCAGMQGYFFSRPLPEAEATALLLSAKKLNTWTSSVA